MKKCFIREVFRLRAIYFIFFISRANLIMFGTLSIDLERKLIKKRVCHISRACMLYLHYLVEIKERQSYFRECISH